MKEDGREQFITDQRFKLETTINSLINYRVSLNHKYRENIVNFFEELLKDEKIRDEKKLRDIAREYGRRIGSFSSVDKNTHEFFSETLEGLGLIKKEIQSLELKYISGIGKDLRLERDIDREYTNMTNNGTMLILDDDVFILNILSRAFESNGYDVRITSNPYEAIDIAKQGQADIAVVDLIMPKLDGFQVLDRMKKGDKDLPIVFITGSDNTETKVNALKRGVEDYITKPFKVEEVVARIESILNRSKNYKVNLNVDELTGAHTRKHFMDTISKYNSDERFNIEKGSIGFLDIDKFKDINDTYGHLVGDKILKLLVDKARKHLGGTNIYRFGGDEFLILFKDKGENEARLNLEKLRRKIQDMKNSFDDIGGDIGVTLSIGICQFESTDSIYETMDRADRALYKAKGLGRNRVICYSDMDRRSSESKRVFIVDSENIASNLLKSRLITIGYQVVLAGHISDIERGFKGHIDLLMIDFKTYKKFSDAIDEEDLVGNKIIMMVSEDEKSELDEYFDLEFEDVIVKPLSVNELENKVRRIIS